MSFAIVVMVAVILAVGAGGYFGLQSVRPTSTTTTTCAGVGCLNATTNDATLFVPYTVGYGQTMTQVAAGLSVSATVGVKGSETIKSFSVSWGDGTTSSGPTSTFNHAYSSAGLYVIQGNATDTKGIVHTGPGQLFPVSVTPNIGDIEKGIYPTVATTFNNGTTGGIYPWVTVGATITVNGSYSHPPTNPFYATLAPSLSAGAGVTQKTESGGATWATGTFTLNQPGTDMIVFTGSSTNGTGTPLSFSYTWGILVTPSGANVGCAACNGPIAKSPHPNQLVIYEVAAGGPVTIDPAAAYYSVDYEVLAQFLQTLVTYNGTDVGPGASDYVPEVATCVPGTTQCAALYSGNDLVQGNNYTFVISSAAKFYDPSTGVSWPIYPSDVYYSFLRGMAFADLPAAAVYAGWIEAQMLLPTGNPNWDAGLHSPYNNTPGNLLSSMYVNDSAFCPSAALSGGGSGCITFNVDGAGTTWPAVLSYLSVPSVGAITPCSWYSSKGATVPGFMGTPGAAQPLTADTGCLLPGGATTTSAAGFQSWEESQSPEAWDAYEGLAVSAYPSPNPSVQWSGVGSGPYYIESLNPGVSITYKANPAYVQPVACAGMSYCQPRPGTYAQTITEYWDSSDTVGIQELTAGYADIAGIETSDTSTQLKLVADGLAGVLNEPTLGVFNYALNTRVNVGLLKTYDPEPVNIQPDSLAYNGLRGFLATAYPYSSVQAEYNVISGVQLGFNYGGFIPQYMGNYYPTNVSWPDYNVSSGQFTNPISSAASVGSAGWYWAQLTDPSSNLYDPQFGTGGYSASNPLHIPALFFEGDPTHQSILQLWGSFVKNLSGGAIVFDVFPVASSIVYSELLPNGQCPWALWFMGWAADYAQPYDYWAAYGADSGDFSSSDTLYPTFVDSAYNSVSCQGYNDPSSFAALSYWAHQPYIEDACQGVAYNLTNYWATAANHDLNIAEGALYWNLVDSIYSHLNLYVNTEQSNQLVTYGPWVDPASINVNLVEGEPGQVYLWWDLTGNGVT